MTPDHDHGPREIPAARRRLAARVRAELDRVGLMLVQDPKLPSICTLVAGEPIRGSWWGHAKGSLIWHLLGDLEEDPALLWPKLVAGKVTLVHPRLAPAFLAVATSRATWQLEGLSAGAAALLAAVDARGVVPVSEVAMPAGEKAGKAALVLEKRLLVDGYQEHTPSGKHVKVLRTWKRWRRDHGHRGRLPSAAKGRATLEDAAASIAAETGARVRLPW